MKKAIFLLIIVMLAIPCFGCHAEVVHEAVTPDVTPKVEATPTAEVNLTATPKPTDTPLEEDVILFCGVELPYDFTDIDCAERMHFVVVYEDYTSHIDRFARFCQDYHDGQEGVAIIIDTVTDKRYAMLYQGDILLCEVTEGSERKRHTLVDLHFENGDAYGVTEEGERVDLLKDAVSKPIDLKGKLEWAYACSAEVRWYLAPTYKGNQGTKKKRISQEKVNELLDILFASPIYERSFSTAIGYDVRVNIETMEDDAFLNLQTDGTTSIGWNGQHFISQSKELYDKIMAYTGIEPFALEDIENVDKITVRYKDNGGEYHKKVVRDQETIRGIVDALQKLECRGSGKSFKTNTQLTFHMDKGDVVCNMCAYPDEDRNKGEFVFQHFYWYASEDAEDAIVALLKLEE